jgi:hypothetical protein
LKACAGRRSDHLTSHHLCEQCELVDVRITGKPLSKTEMGLLAMPTEPAVAGAIAGRVRPALWAVIYANAIDTCVGDN